MHKPTSCFLSYKKLFINIARRTSCRLIKGSNLINAWKKMNQFERENKSISKRKWFRSKEKLNRFQRENESVSKRKCFTSKEKISRFQRKKESIRTLNQWSRTCGGVHPSNNRKFPVTASKKDKIF